MIASVKARYSEGVLKPMEPVDLKEDEEVLVSIEDPRSGASKTATLLDMLDEIHRSVPQEEWNDGPTYGARNFKHCLYGWPKDDAPVVGFGHRALGAGKTRPASAYRYGY